MSPGPQEVGPPTDGPTLTLEDGTVLDGTVFDGTALVEGRPHRVGVELAAALGRAEVGRLDGRPLAEVAERISWCPFPRSLDGEVKLRAQLAAAAAAFDEEIDEMALDLLAATGMERLLDGETWYLSAGEETIAALAVATARPFELLVLDRPMAGLDARTRRTVRAWLDAVAEAFLVVVGEPET